MHLFEKKWEKSRTRVSSLIVDPLILHFLFSFCLSLLLRELHQLKALLILMPVLRSRVILVCAVGKSETFRWATGQANLANRMKNCSTGQGAVVWVRKPNFGSFWCVSRLYAKFDCPVARQNFPLFSYCAWLWNWVIAFPVHCLHEHVVTSRGHKDSQWWSCKRFDVKSRPAISIQSASGKYLLVAVTWADSAMPLYGLSDCAGNTRDHVLPVVWLCADVGLWFVIWPRV